MRAYWFFVVYVSPILLVTVCAFLAWRAFQDSSRTDAEEGSPSLGESGSAAEPEAWSTDPDAWKGG